MRCISRPTDRTRAGTAGDRRLTAGFNTALKTGFSPRAVTLCFVSCCVYALSMPAQVKPGEPIKAIGCFMNVRSDGEHADGYSVHLWFRGRQIIGLIAYHRGLIGDPPIGILSDVQYESSTGKISFKAKLTSGLHSCRIHKNVPSHDLVSFQGFLNGGELKGNIELTEQLDTPPVVMDTRTDFLMRKDSDCHMQDYGSHDAWWRYWEPIYKARGARW
jgi:hypothetical protein